MIRKAMIVLLTLLACLTAGLWAVGSASFGYEQYRLGSWTCILGIESSSCELGQEGEWRLHVGTAIGDVRFDYEWEVAAFSSEELSPTHLHLWSLYCIKTSVERFGVAGIAYNKINVYLPLWPFFLLFVSYPIIAFIRGPVRRSRRRREGLCLKCGYNLRGLTEPRCPECEAEFDPSTMPQSPD